MPDDLTDKERRIIWNLLRSEYLVGESRERLDEVREYGDLSQKIGVSGCNLTLKETVQ
jgi:hypothetical protein